MVTLNEASSKALSSKFYSSIFQNLFYLNIYDRAVNPRRRHTLSPLSPFVVPPPEEPPEAREVPNEGGGVTFVPWLGRGMTDMTVLALVDVHR
jgi:hypothetical protein